jgi:hypothetical protein
MVGVSQYLLRAGSGQNFSARRVCVMYVKHHNDQAMIGLQHDPYDLQ